MDFSEATKISPVIQHALKSTIFSLSVSTKRINSQLDMSHIIIRPDEQPETKIPYSCIARNTKTDDAWPRIIDSVCGSDKSKSQTSYILDG